MARRRHQDPKPRREGQQWVVYYWADTFENGERRRIRKRQPLGPAEMSWKEAKKAAQKFLEPLNQGRINIGSATKFADYVEQVFKPVVLPTFAKSTQDRYISVYETHLHQQFGRSCLHDMTPVVIQRFVSGMADSGLSRESVDKIRDVLSSIMRSAVEYQYLSKNPAQGIRLPVARRGKRGKPYLTQQQFATLVQSVGEPYATMLYTAAYTGLRASELIGLRWRNVHDDSITVEERYCRGDWGAPKSDASNATVPVNRAVIDRLFRLKARTITVRAGRATRRYPAVRSARPDDLVFQSPAKGRPMRDNNVLVRHIKPAARALGMPWVNWQVLRRSFATWLKLKGADVKDAQALMRHSRASTTLDVYQQFVPESQRRVVDGLTVN